jgi:hypothetical protein
MSDDPIDVTMHPVLIKPFKEWLAGRGLMLARFPEEMQEEDRLEAFFVAPTEENMRRMRRQ